MKKYGIKKLHRHSLRFWLRIFFLILFGFLLMAGFGFEYMIHEMLLKLSVEEFDRTFQIYISELDASLESVHNYLYMNFESSEAVVRLETGGTRSQMAFASQDVANQLNKILMWDVSMESLIFYSPQGPEQTFIEKGLGVNYVNRVQLRDLVKAEIDAEREEMRFGNAGFIFLPVGQQEYLVRFYKVSNSYIGVIISMDTIFQTLQSNMAEEDSCFYVADSEGNLIAGTCGGFLEQIDFPEQGMFVEIDGEKYLQIQKSSQNEDFSIGVLLSQKTIYGDYEKIRWVLWSLILVILFSEIVVAVIVSYFVHQPVQKMIQGMQKVSNGEWDTVISEDELVLEFSGMAGSFNQMVRQVSDLKIQNYENELNIQKAHLQYLQLQINPHFYLNALNIIYSLAELEDYKTIQRTTMALIRYLRFMFQDATTLVQLEDELQHVKSYIDIQQIRFSDSLNYQEEVDEKVRKALVPPYVIQSFVENSVKYALKFHKENMLKVRVELIQLKQQQMIKIMIQDNGEGYSEEVLAAMENHKDLGSDSRHNIGLRNVKKRLEIIYGKRASLQFENDNGAVTIIQMPFIIKDDEEIM